MKEAHGEQLEISLKAHLCAGGMVEVPCSHVAHSYRYKNYYRRFGEDGEDYMLRNFKRLAEVWFDEYKDLVYRGSRSKFADTDEGDLTRAKVIQRGLHCKPFRYFLEFVAPEILERYPLVDKGFFAQGAIQSKATPNICLEVPMNKKDKQIALKDCEKDLVHPSPRQFFKLSWHRNIQHFNYDYCIQGLKIAECHYRGGNQMWKFDIKTSQIQQESATGTTCLAIDSDNYVLLIEKCDETRLEQKWNWGEKNITALQAWENSGVPLDSLEL